MTASAIETEFQTIYKVRQARKENRQDYFDRLITEVNKTSDDDWERLTPDAQRWFNLAVKAWDVEKEVPDFPDVETESSDDADEGPEDEETGEDERMATTAKKRAAPAKKRAAAPAAKKPVTNGNGKLPLSGGVILKRALLRNMRATDKDLVEALKKKDFKLSPVRISLIRSEFRQTMRMLQEDELLKKTFEF